MAYLIGACLACYFLVGRWNFLRLEGDFDQVAAYAEPRVWLVAVAGLATLLMAFHSRDWLMRFRVSVVDAAVVAFLAYMLVSATWAPDAELAIEKAYEVGLLLLVALIVAAARQRDAAEHLATGFFATFLVIGVAIAMVAIAKSTDGRVFAPGGGPNTFGRNMGLMAIAAVYCASQWRASMFAKVAAGVVVVVAVLLVLMCGSRGSLLSGCVGCSTLILLARTSVLKKCVAIAGLAVLAGVALFYTSAGRHAMDVFQHRIVEQTIENRYMASRDDLWSEALELGQKQPLLGLGLNGYRAHSWTYPHNMVLETWVEGGLFGLGLLLLTGGLFIRQAWRYRHQVSRPAVAALLLLAAAAQTSGDFYDSRGVFLLLVIVTPPGVTLSYAHRSSQALAMLPAARLPAVQQ